MFVHPKYKFYGRNTTIISKHDSIGEEEKEGWWRDIVCSRQTQVMHDTEDKHDTNEIPINIHSTLKAIRDYVKKHNLGIKCSGKGRTKTVILKDIENMMTARKMSNDQDVDMHDQEEKDHDEKDVDFARSTTSICPIPFDSFKHCYDSSMFEHASLDASKVECRWIGGSRIHDQITAVSLLLTWQNRWLFEEKCIEEQFMKIWRCTRNKLEKGMFGQKCVGCIVAMYREAIIGCVMVHRFPLFSDSEQIAKNASLQNSVLDITRSQLVNAPFLNRAMMKNIEEKNSYLYIESVSIGPLTNPQQYALIFRSMLNTLFRCYPNELFLSNVMYENIKIWQDMGFAPVAEQIVLRRWRKQNDNLAQVYKILKLTSST